MPYKNKEDSIAHNKRYYQENKERFLINGKKYYWNNLEECRRKQKQYRDENPEKIREQKRQSNNRVCIYRRTVEEELNHKLVNKECVHHIDMNESNNNIENLYIYRNNGKHHKGHASLNKLVSKLLKDNIINFVNGEYIRG